MDGELVLGHAVNNYEILAKYLGAGANCGGGGCAGTYFMNLN